MLIHRDNFIISWSDEYLLTVLLTKLFNSSTYYIDYDICLHPYMFFFHVFMVHCIIVVFVIFIIHSISTILGVEMKYTKYHHIN